MSNCLVPTQQPTISNYNERIAKLEKKLSEANALIAMKDEALKQISDGCVMKAIGINKYSAEDVVLEYQKLAERTLSASPESLSAWEAEKLLPLQRQVGMLHKSLERIACIWDEEYADNILSEVKATLSNAQAVAEAYDREHAAKVLEEAAKQCGKVGDVMTREHNFAQGSILAHSLRVDFERKAAELRAANKKD